MSDSSPWIQTFSGSKFHPLAPNYTEIHLSDIAHALSLQCRWTGHVFMFYSVAEHSVRVSRICNPRDALWGIFHDASEAWLQDLAAPIKATEQMRFFREAEDQITAAVAKRFNLTLPIPESVHLADKVMLATERRDLMSHKIPWSIEGVQPLETRITPWTSDKAEHMFLSRFRELTEGY